MTLSSTTADSRHESTDPCHELDALQWGHLRNIVRLSRQMPGDWSDMGPFDPTNEGDDAYRYQLAYMAYTLGLAQYHYVPAYREVFRETLASLIRKMLRHDVWGYWELTSRGSKVMDPDLEYLVDGWVDPVIRKNVMFSGHLLMMVSLYEMLYRDGRFFEPGSLTFECRPPFRGMGPQDFPYDLGSLAAVIEEQFAASGGMGCECEPNGIFVYCNQFPMLGLAHLDQVRGTEIAPRLMRDFRDAWARESSLFSVDASADLPVFLMVKQNEIIYEDSEDNKEAASVVSWGPFMHVWQKEYVEALYPLVLPRIRKQTAWGYGVSLEQFHRTHLEYQARPSMDLVDPMMLGVHTHGMLALLAAEMGDADTRDGLLAHSDAVMNPTWKNGGLFYPRCDELDTERYVTCVMGNGLLGAARINPRNGIHDLYAHPWSEADLNDPQLTGVAFPDVLVTLARFDRESRRLRIRLVAGDTPPSRADFRVTGLDSARGLRVTVNDIELESASWDRVTGDLVVSIPFADACDVDIINN